MAEKTDLPTDEEVDKMKLGKITRLLHEFGMTEDETDDLDKEEAREELKKRTSDARATAATRRRTGQAAENLREALAQYKENRRRLAAICQHIHGYLPNLDKSTKKFLKTQLERPAEDILRDVLTQLTDLKEECPILVAGEISSGKSTFLNLLLGEDILSVAHMSSTSTICEVKYGETRQAVVHLRKSAINILGPKTVTIPLDGTEEHQEDLKNYMHLKGASRDSLPPAERIEIFWPLPLLQGGIVIVDSPGVGESKMMDKVVADYIPKAFAFLYIIDSSKAGGIQQDRLGQLLQLYARKENVEDFYPESAIFICNKLDLVPPKEQGELKSETLRKLSEMWPGLEESNQLFFTSTGKAVGPGKILSDNFSKVLDGLDMLLLKSLDIKLESQYRLLDRLSSTALTHIDSRLNVARKNLTSEAKVDMHQEAQDNLQSFQEEVNRGMKELESMVRTNTEITKNWLSDLVKTGQLNQDILFAVRAPVPFWVKKLFGVWYSNILAKLKNERKEGNSNDLSRLEDLYTALADDLASCPSFKTHITCIEKCFEQTMKEVIEPMESAHRRTMLHLCISPIRHMVMNVHIILDKPSPWQQHVAFWKGLSLSSLRSRLARWGKSKFVKAVWGAQSSAECTLNTCLQQAHEGTNLIDILMQALSSEELINELTERQIQPQKDLMALLQADITKMMTVMDQTIEDTFRDKFGNDEETVKKYEPQSEDINSFLGMLAMFYLASIRKYEYELDNISGWTERDNWLGRGSFGEVYQVVVPWKGAETRCAALKIGLMPYNIITTQTACDFLKEEDNLRKLKGEHIVEYYGTACRREARGLRLGLVMELCDGTLEDRIVKKRDLNPAWWDSNSETQAAAFSYTKNMAVQLCEGLKTIHDARYMHRDLKLLNILVTKDDTVKLADVGQAKQEVKITGTVTGTPLYAAPEVKERKVYDNSADIYSLGLILWEMWYGRTLYGHQDNAYAEKMDEYLKKGIDIRMPAWRGSVPPIPEWTRLIHQCLKKDPKERPKIQECLERISSMKVEKNITGKETKI